MRAMATHLRTLGIVGLLFGGLGAGASWGVAPPYPPSTVGLTWHETLNLGTDNDNWPTTWADDDDVYAAGGDGAGFGGERGNWICRLRGNPPSLTGANVTRISTESGPQGTKGSGILSLAGKLYCWARNADGDGNYATLGWSTDHGSSWTWGPTFTLLGYPTFVNFGRNYSGARDSYVYTVSHDDSSAYATSDRFILLRVPATSITNMSAYQYFVRRDAAGNPVWSSDPAQRGAVFTYVEGGQGQCERSGISYHASLGRYLWYQRYPLLGGFGVYDAPQPWGPWTTVYFTTGWDEDPGDCGGFCTKYSSGSTVWLVFSGNDNLRLRRATVAASPVAALLPPAVAFPPLATYPNPFTSGLRTDFRLSARGAVRIDVRDVLGRQVVTLLDQALEGGDHSAEWDGRDERGARVAAGVYFVRLDVDGRVESRRVVRLR
ncbi:MAG: T9SS type A sorting domain-containing protein [bacterium]